MISIANRIRDKREVRSTEDFEHIKAANLCFLLCICIEMGSIILMPLMGMQVSRIAIYGLTFLMAVYMSYHYKTYIPVKKLNPDMFIKCIGLAVCGIPIAMLLNGLADMLANYGAEQTQDINRYPIGVALFAFAIVPAFVEEYVFRGFILETYDKVEAIPAIFFSSLFFALLHFSLGSVLYGFFYGCLFAMVVLATDNILYSMVMHLIFNSINVGMCYVDIGQIPAIAIVSIMIVGTIGFCVLAIVFFRKYQIIVLNIKHYKPWDYLTKEGYVAVGICSMVILMLLMM